MPDARGDGEGRSYDAEKLERGVRNLYGDMERAFHMDGHVTSFRVRGPRDPADDYMIVGKRINDEGLPEVCFHGATSLPDALTGFGNRIRNGTLKWGPDKYAGNGK